MQSLFSFFLLFNVYLFICLCWVLVAAHGILPCFSIVVACRLQKTQTQELPSEHSRPGVCRILPGQGSNPVLEGGFLTTRPPGKSLLPFFSQSATFGPSAAQLLGALNVILHTFVILQEWRILVRRVSKVTMESGWHRSFCNYLLKTCL